MCYNKNMKIKFIILTILFIPFVSLAQFVEEPAVTAPANTPAVRNNFSIANIFDVLILLSALLFIISIFGFIIGILKLITAGGNEIVAEKSHEMLVTSGWILTASILSFLLINIVKYFIY